MTHDELMKNLDLAIKSNARGEIMYKTLRIVVAHHSEYGGKCIACWSRDGFNVEYPCKEIKMIEEQLL